MDKYIILPVLILMLSLIPTIIANTSMYVSAFHPCPPFCHEDRCEQKYLQSSNNCPSPHSEYQNEEYEMYMHSPKIEFPTNQEIYDYLEEAGIKEEFNIITNSNEGIPDEIKTAIADDEAWIAWTVDGTNQSQVGNQTFGSYVFARSSLDQGENFGETIRLNPPNQSEIHNLQLAVSDSGRFVDIAWISNVNGTNMLFLSTSSNYGQDFLTYPLSLPGYTDAFDAQLISEKENVLLTWKQQLENGRIIILSHGTRW